MDAVPDPKNIVESVRGNLQDKNNHVIKKSTPAKNNDIHMAMARMAIENDRVKLVDVGAWIVKESDGLSLCSIFISSRKMFLSLYCYMLPHHCL